MFGQFQSVHRAWFPTVRTITRKQMQESMVHLTLTGHFPLVSTCCLFIRVVVGLSACIALVDPCALVVV